MRHRFRLALVLAAAVTAGSALGWIRFHQRGQAQDGEGLLGSAPARVFLREDHNLVQWSEGGTVRRWTGRPRTMKETVCFDGHAVSPFAWGRVLAGRGLVIRFRPDRVDVFDLDHLRGVSYSPRDPAPAP